MGKRKKNKKIDKISDNSASVMMEYCAFYANDQLLLYTSYTLKSP